MRLNEDPKRWEAMRFRWATLAALGLLTLASLAAFARNSAPALPMQRLQFSAVEVTAEQFVTMRKFAMEALGLHPFLDTSNLVAFRNADGSIYELYGPGAPDAVWRHGQGGMVFGFLTADIRATSTAVQAAGGVLIGDINVAPGIAIDGGDYAYRFYRAVDNRVYALAQNRGFRR